MSNRLKIFKHDYDSLSKSEYAAILFGSMVGLSVLDIPNDLGKVAYQDNWIAAGLGCIYPLYMVILSIYLSKKSPKDNILNLSKKCFGNICGSILNFIFLFYFFFLLLTTITEYSIMMKNFAVTFLTPIEIVGIVTLLSGYVASNGIKNIGKICKITFFFTFILVISSIPALRAGKFINIYPILQSGFTPILNGAIKSSLAYSGIEIVFLIYPMLNEKKEQVKSSTLPIFFACIIYMWVTFISVYYLGVDIVIKSKWSFLLVTESVTATVINNYKYVFIFIWSLIIFKTISIFYYASAYIGNHIFTKLNIKKFIYLIYPVCIFICVKYNEKFSINNFVGTIIELYVIFCIVYVTSISIIISIRTNR